MRPMICGFSMALLLSPVVLTARGAGADESCWPPLNGTAQIIENPVRVGDAVFGSGSYSYFVGRYSVPSLHCEKTINSGPREWYLMVESGRVLVKGEPAGTRRSPLPEPSASLPALPALSAPPTFSSPPLGGLPLGALPLLRPIDDALPQLPSLVPVANLRPLD